VATAGLWRSQTTGSTSEEGRGKGSGKAREVCGTVALSIARIARKGRERGDKGLVGCRWKGKGTK
jgi:hypothetical protein